MAMIFTHQRGPKKPKKKPGWQDAKYEHEQWLKGLQSTKLFETKRVKTPSTKLPSKLPSLSRVLQEKQRAQGQSIIGGEASMTKKVLRPEIVYKDDPEMLERELKARERKFAIAPAYNKGAAQLVTDDMMKDLQAGGGRRRS